MPIDTSFYNRTPPQAPNPLEMMSQMQGIQHQQMQNQLMQRTMAAQVARGQAYAANTDANGNVNTGGAMAAMAQDPNAAPGLDEAAQSNQALSAAQLDQHIKQIGVTTQILGSGLKLATNPDGTPNPAALEGPGGDAILKDLGRQMALAGTPPDMVASELNSLPADGQGRYQKLTQFLISGIQAGQQGQALYGQLVSQNDGKTTTNYRVPEIAGAAPPPMAMKTTPQFDATPTTGPVGPGGAPTTITQGQRANMGQVTVGLTPQQQAQQTASGSNTGANDANQAAAFEATAAPDRTASVRAATQNLRADLSSSNTGPQAKNVAHINSLFAEILGPGAVDTKGMSATEAFNKNAIMLGRMLQGAGGHTDSQEMHTLESNPSTALSKQGNLRVLSWIDGMNDYNEAKNKAWQAWKGDTTPGHNRGPGTFQQFQTTFARIPNAALAFQYKYMTQDQKTELKKTMSAHDYGELRDTYNSLNGGQ